MKLPFQNLSNIHLFIRTHVGIKKMHLKLKTGIILYTHTIILCTLELTISCREFEIWLIWEDEFNNVIWWIYIISASIYWSIMMKRWIMNQEMNMYIINSIYMLEPKNQTNPFVKRVNPFRKQVDEFLPLFAIGVCETGSTSLTNRLKKFTIKNWMV